MVITDEMIEKYRKSLISEEKALATVEKYCRVIVELKCWLKDAAINKVSLLGFRDDMLAKRSTATVNGYISAINSFLVFCRQRRYKLKTLRVQRKAFLEERRELNEAEYARLIAAAQEQGNERLCLVMQTICGTGIRVSELSFITVEAARAGQADVALKGKYRTVLIQKALQKKLLTYAKSRGVETGPIFVTRSGKPLDRVNIAHEMKKLCAIAGVDRSKVFPHNLRHLFARKFYAIEKNLSHLADILGHSSVETTRIYVAASAKTVARTLNRMRLVV